MHLRVYTQANAQPEFYNHTNIIEVKVCECVCFFLSLLHAQTTGPILIKFRMREGDTLD